MGTAEGGKHNPKYYLSNSVEEAIHHLSKQVYDLLPQDNKAFPKLFALPCNERNTQALTELAYGRSFKLGDDNHSFGIGLAGKIRALMCLLPLSPAHKDSVGGTPHSCAIAVYGQESENRTRLLSFFIKITTTTFSGKNIIAVTEKDITKVYESVVRSAITWLHRTPELRDIDTAKTRAKLTRVLEQTHKSPKSCADEIFSTFNLKNTRHGPWRDQVIPQPRHDFEPVLQQFIDNEVAAERDDDPEIIKSVDDVIEKLTSANTAPKKPNIALVLGDEQSGKKSVVGDLLRRMKNRSPVKDAISFPVGNPATEIEELPILAMSLRKHDYGSLAAYILAFLQRVNGTIPETADLAETARALKTSHIRSGSLTAILKLVADEHRKTSVLFVLLDAQGLDRDSIQRVLRNSGLYGLLASLWHSNKHSRYLITTTEIDFVNTPTALKLSPKNSVVNVPLPMMSRFAWYLSSADLERYREPDPLLPDEDGKPLSMESKLNQLAASIDENLEVTGDVLLVLSALFAARIGNEAFYKIVKAYLNSHLDEDKNLVPPNEALIYLELINSLADQNLLLPMTLIAATRATDDIITSSSLKELCRRAIPVKERKTFENDWARTLRKLDDVSAGARTLFLSSYPHVRPDDEELGFLEEQKDSGQDWFISSAVANAFMQHMLASPNHNELAQNALRLIATAARRRAQLKRIRRAEDSNASDRGEIARDIQCFVSLMASLPSDLNADADARKQYGAKSNRALRLSLDQVFTINQGFKAPLALRFAVQCVLRQDIDEGYRLSMVTDQDELRLRLYLLIFCPVGQLHRWTISQLRADPNCIASVLPTKIPQHLVGLFDDETLLELLLTVSLAAYHSQLPHLVAWAWNLSKTIACNREYPDRYRHLALRARLSCTMIDAGIASGHNLADKGNLSTLLKWTIDESKVLNAEIGEDLLLKNARVADLLPQKLKLVQARMRLAAREAELQWIANNDMKSARNSYRRLELLEHDIARYIDQAEPVVLSGRTARRYARLLAGDFPVFAEPWFKQGVKEAPDTVTRKIRHVIEANVGRLNHYAGADRIGVLVDQSRRHCIANNLELAKLYAEDAFKRLETSKISHGGRLDVLAVSAGVYLTIAERGILDGADVQTELEIAQRRIKTLLDVGKRLKFGPASVVAQFLQARCTIASNAFNQRPYVDQKAKSQMVKSAALAERCGYMSARNKALEWLELAETISS